MTKHIALILFAAVAACGSKAPAPTTPPVAAVHEHEHEGTAHVGAASEAPGPTGQESARPAVPAEPAKPDVADVKAELLASERSAWAAAQPVFEKACASCHTKAGKKAAKKKLDHFNMDAYPLGGHHTQTIGFTIRDVLGISGKKPTMPYDKPGSVQGDNLAKIKRWTDAWEAAEKAKAHPAVTAGLHDD